MHVMKITCVRQVGATVLFTLPRLSYQCGVGECLHWKAILGIALATPSTVHATKNFGSHNVLRLRRNNNILPFVTA